MRKKILCSWWAVLAFMLPSKANAHVKWFVDSGGIAPDATLAFHFSDPAVQIWIGALALGLILAFLLDRAGFLQPPQFLIDKGVQWHGGIVHLFQVIVGISLMVTAYEGAILAPHLKESAKFALGLRGVQALVGLLFVSNIMVFVGASLLFVLFFASTAVFGFLMSLEYFNLLGIAVFLLLIKSPRQFRNAQRCIWALPLLRFHTGVALSVLAFSEKLAHPELAMAFMTKHDVNFMKILGFSDFSNHLFVLSAGCSELLFGLILIFGFVTRLNTLVLASFLTASNIYFFLMGKSAEGTLEVIGHANIFAIGMILIIYGAGRKIRLASDRPFACETTRADDGLMIPANQFSCDPWCASHVPPPPGAVAKS